LHHPDAPRRHLIDDAMIERDDAIGNVFFQTKTSERDVAALTGHDDCDTFFLEPAKQPAKLRANDGLIRQCAEKNFDRIEHYALRLDRINRVTESNEETFKIVLAGFLELRAIHEDVIQH